MNSFSIVQRLWQAALTFALKIVYVVFLESLGRSFRARIMFFVLKMILIPASVIDKYLLNKGLPA